MCSRHHIVIVSVKEQPEYPIPDTQQPLCQHGQENARQHCQQNSWQKKAFPKVDQQIVDGRETRQGIRMNWQENRNTTVCRKCVGLQSSEPGFRNLKEMKTVAPRNTIIGFPYPASHYHKFYQGFSAHNTQ